MEILAAHEIRHRSPNALVPKAVEQAKTGDLSALDFLYVRFADDVRDAAQEILSDFQAAEDLTQAVFDELRTPLQWYEPAEAPLHTWILRMVRNAAMDRLDSSRAAV